MRQKNRKKSFFKLALGGCLLCIAGISLVWGREYFVVFEEFLFSLGAYAPFLFLVFWLVAPALFLPGFLLTLAGGALFGPWYGTLYTSLGATTGATLSFLLGRYLFSDWVAQKAGGKLQKLRLSVEANGWLWVAFLRLVPLFPFNLSNYALGLSNISLKGYIFPTFLCMLPGTLGYSYLGAFGKAALKGEEGWVEKGLLAFGLVCGAMLLPLIFVRTRKLFSSPTEEN